MSTRSFLLYCVLSKQIFECCGFQTKIFNSVLKERQLFANNRIIPITSEEIAQQPPMQFAEVINAAQYWGYKVRYV